MVMSRTCIHISPHTAADHTCRHHSHCTICSLTHMLCKITVNSTHIHVRCTTFRPLHVGLCWKIFMFSHCAVLCRPHM